MSCEEVTEQRYHTGNFNEEHLLRLTDMLYTARKSREKKPKSVHFKYMKVARYLFNFPKFMTMYAGWKVERTGRDRGGGWEEGRADSDGEAEGKGEDEADDRNGRGEGNVGDGGGVDQTALEPMTLAARTMPTFA